MAGGVFSEAQLFGMTVRESATDGSDFTNPAADYRRLFLGEDGLLHLKDSAGAVTDIGASGIPATLLDAKGDLIAASAADTAARLAVIAGNGSSLVVASGETTGLKWQLNNLAAAAAPAVTDDSGDGYAIGSRWIDTTADKEYVATDVTAGAAVWKETTAGGGGGGALVFLEAHTASASATLDFTTFISSTYDDYLIRFINVLPATTNTTLYLRMSTDGGSTYDAGAAAYTNAAWRFHSGNGSAGSGATASFIKCSGDDGVSNSATWGGLMGEMTLTNPGGSGYKRAGGFVGHGDGATTVLENAILGGLYLNTTAVNAIRFLMSSGNITSGTIRVYGIAKS